MTPAAPGRECSMEPGGSGCSHVCRPANNCILDACAHYGTAAWLALRCPEIDVQLRFFSKIVAEVSKKTGPRTTIQLPVQDTATNAYSSMLRESNFLAGPGLGIGVGKFSFRNGLKLIAKAQLLLHINPNVHGPPDTIKWVDVLVALQKGHTDVASDEASCLSHISIQAPNPMRMRTYPLAELIQVVSIVPKHSPHPVDFNGAHSIMIGNKGADAYACTALLMDTMDIALPDARNFFHNFYRLVLKSSHGRTGETRHSHNASTHYITNMIDKL
eukprot:1160933-Pelagomonas_calceolata.AAC.6